MNAIAEIGATEELLVVLQIRLTAQEHRLCRLRELHADPRVLANAQRLLINIQNHISAAEERLARLLHSARLSGPVLAAMHAGVSPHIWDLDTLPLMGQSI